MGGGYGALSILHSAMAGSLVHSNARSAGILISGRLQKSTSTARVELQVVVHCHCLLQGQEGVCSVGKYELCSATTSGRERGSRREPFQRHSKDHLEYSARPNLQNTGAPPPRAEAKAPVPTPATPAKKAPPPPRVGTPASPPPPDDEKKGSPAGRSSPGPPPGKPQGGPTRATPPGENHACIHLIGYVLFARCCSCPVFNFC